MLKNDEVDYCTKCTVKPIAKEHMCEECYGEEEMKIKNDDIQIIAIPIEEYKDLIRENEKIRHELKLLRALIEYASNNNKGEK